MSFNFIFAEGMSKINLEKTGEVNGILSFNDFRKCHLCYSI